MYPSSLIPHTEYTLSIDISCLQQENDFYLIRRVDLPLDEFYDEDFGTIDSIAFNAKELPGLSMNLLCNNCDHSSTSHRTTGSAMNDWDGSPVNIDDFDGFYSFNDAHTNIYIKLSEIHQVPFPIKYNADKATKKQLANKGVAPSDLEEDVDSEGKQVLFGKGNIKVIHKPTFLNYWHFQLDIHAENKELTSKVNETLRSALKLFIDQVLTGIAIIQPPDQETVDPVACYRLAI